VPIGGNLIAVQYDQYMTSQYDSRVQLMIVSEIYSDSEVNDKKNELLDPRDLV